MMMMNYPAPIHHLLEGTPTRFHAATAQAVFPALATYVPGDAVGKFPLNNETYRLNCGFFSLLCGDSASGKSLVDRVVNRIMAPIVKEDQLRRLKYNEYLEKLERATKHTKRLPKKPHVFYRSLSANITEAALLERLQWAEQNGMGCACHILMAELDQLITMCGSADLASAYIRLMFKGESTGKELKTSASHAGIPCALNLNVSCTPGVARTRLGGKAAYDGTTGRVNAILMPTIDGVESLLNFEAVMDFTKEFDNRLTAALNSLSSFHGLVETPPELAEAVRETYERLTRYYYTTLDQKRLATWTLRSSIIAWRKGLLMMMMQGGVYTHDIADFVACSMEEDMAAKQALWGEELLMDKPIELLAHPSAGRRSLLLEALPQEFTAEQANEIRVKSGAKDNMGLTRNLLARWKYLGYIEDTEKGYRKVK